MHGRWPFPFSCRGQKHPPPPLLPTLTPSPHKSGNMKAQKSSSYIPTISLKSVNFSVSR